MFHVILFEPEIPPNAGNVIRLCANTGATLHLVRPLGFALDDARVKRAGLDYHELARVRAARRPAGLPGGARRRPGYSRSRPETGSATTSRATARRCLPVRSGNERPAARTRRRLAGRPPHPPAHGPRQPQPQSLERRRRRRVRSLAPARLPGQRLTRRHAAGTDAANPSRGRAGRDPRGSEFSYLFSSERASRVPARAVRATLSADDQFSGVTSRWSMVFDDLLERHALVQHFVDVPADRHVDAVPRSPPCAPLSPRGSPRPPGRSPRSPASTGLPAASARPKRRLRDWSSVQVSTRSPSPARPISVSRFAPSATPSRIISTRPRVIRKTRVFDP